MISRVAPVTDTANVVAACDEFWPLGLIPELPDELRTQCSDALREAGTESGQEAARALAHWLQNESAVNRTVRQKRLADLFPTIRGDETLRWLESRERNIVSREGKRSWNELASVAISDIPSWRNAGRKAVENVLFAAAMLSLELSIERDRAECEEKRLPTAADPAEMGAASEASPNVDLSLYELLDVAADEVLRERQRQMWQLRYAEGSTLAEIGEQWGITRERVRQVLMQSAHVIARVARSHAACAALAERLQVLDDLVPGEYETLFVLAESEFPHLPLESAAKLLLALGGHSVPADLDKARRQRRLDIAAARLREKAHARSLAALNSLLPNAYWPAQPTYEWPLPATASREVREEAAELAYFSAKLQRVVTPESELELRFFEVLEQHPDVLAYQEQPLAIPYQSSGALRHYHPDVAIRLRTGACVLAELKPFHQMALHRNLLKWRAALDFTRSHGLGLLITDTRRTLRDVSTHPVDPRFRDVVLHGLQNGAIAGFSQYSALLKRFDLTPRWDDLNALVIQERLRFQIAPFGLARQ